MTFRNKDPRRREVYTSPYDLAGLARIIGNSADEYDEWKVHITLGRTGRYIFGPYRVDIDLRNRMWRVQSAETIHGLHAGEGWTEAEGNLQDSSPGSIYAVLKKAGYR